MHVVFAASGAFPSTSAYSSRLHNLADALVRAGHRVTLIVDEQGTSTELPAEVRVLPLGLRTSSARDRLWGGRLAAAALSALDHVDVVITRSDAGRVGPITSIAHRRGIPVVLEVCEHYDPSAWRGGRWNPFAWQYERAFSRDFHRVDGVLAISSRLDEEFAAIQPRMVIPTLLPVPNHPATHLRRGPLTLVYAGNPGASKETFGELAGAIEQRKWGPEQIVVHVYGIETAHLRDRIDASTWAATVDCFVAHGKVPRTEVIEAVAGADLTYFLRPLRESSQAGFPTKLAESMSVGTPVMTNLTGDIGRHVVEGATGFVVANYDDAAVGAALDRAMALPAEEWERLRVRTWRHARENFDVDCHVAGLSQLLREVVQR